MKANFETMYNHIGHLFYAIASEQKKIVQADCLTLKEIVARGWHSRELSDIIDHTWRPVDNHDADAQVHLIEHILTAITDSCKDQMDSHLAFEVFENFYLAHSLNFSDALKTQILKTCGDIKKELAAPTGRNGFKFMDQAGLLLNRSGQRAN